MSNVHTGVHLLHNMVADYWYYYLALIAVLTVITGVFQLLDWFTGNDRDFLGAIASGITICSFSIVMADEFDNRWQHLIYRCQDRATYSTHHCLDVVPGPWVFTACMLHAVGGLVAGVLLYLISEVIVEHLDQGFEDEADEEEYEEDTPAPMLPGQPSVVYSVELDSHRSAPRANERLLPDFANTAEV
jgi:hypothetical protein